MNRKIFWLICCVFSAINSFGQSQHKVNWQNLDLKEDGVLGMSTEKAYRELLNGKQVVPVIVAVIDAGVDIKHEDLKDKIWTNKKEIPGNGKDDDKNGYVDDVHGWNFLGSAKGNITYGSLERVRLYKKLHDQFSNKKANDTTGYGLYLALKKELDDTRRDDSIAMRNAQKYDSILQIILAKLSPTPGVTDMEAYHSSNDSERSVQTYVADLMRKGMSVAAIQQTQIKDVIDTYQKNLRYQLNPDYDPRAGDASYTQKGYGNPDVAAYNAMHGTLSAGIIAANRDNAIGIKGVAACAVILPVRESPDGEDRDEDMANSIRYAVDNGAKVINISTGKHGYSMQKKLVDEAVRYAMQKDVLIIHAAGNDGANIDGGGLYPNPFFEDGNIADNWIEVGASGYLDDDHAATPFSNYGALSVDVFAPGELSESTLPDSKYGPFMGTSMAAPMVSGLAALIRGYYPKLSAKDVKQIIMQSVYKPKQGVLMKQDDKDIQLPFSSLCISGGIVNAYEALKLAGIWK